jgi:hypothetical protein
VGSEMCIRDRFSKAIDLAGQNVPHQKPPKFPKNKPIKHLGSKSAF